MTETALRERQVERLIFFSDAAFAFALMLLVAEVRLPAAIPEGQFWTEFARIAPQFGAYLISFALASLWWLVHVSATRELRTFDWPTAICNLIFLAFIVLLPFSAATFGQNIMSKEALGLYWIVNAGASFAMTLMFVVMSRGKGRLIGGLSGGERALRIFQSIAPGLVFALGAYWAFTDQIWLSRFCAMLLAPLMMAAGVIDARMRRKRVNAEAPPAP